MPMYYPDLNSVKCFAEEMRDHLVKVKRYTGLIPSTEKELPEARQQLGNYMRDVWHDPLGALEIELAVTEADYHDKLQEHIRGLFFK